MEQHISEALKQALPTESIPLSSNELVSDNYEGITLTAEEANAALLDGRRRKSERLQQEEKEARAAEVRRQLTEQWTTQKTDAFMKWRAPRILGKPMEFGKISEGNNSYAVYRLLCLYFSNDPEFVIEANLLGVKSPDLRKGILISGRIGAGKTTLMRLFGVNQRQVFMCKNAAEVANEWQAQGEGDKKERTVSIIEALSTPHMLPVNDIDNFYHRFAGLCLDDCGTEDIKVHYGNRKNVIGDLIEARYANQSAGIMFHLTTNFNSDQLKEFYGPRVSSRLRETMNVIELKGEDRRK